MRTLWRNTEGGPAVEFALVAAFLAICLPALLDVSVMLHSALKLGGGMRAGEQYALKYPADVAGVQNAVAVASGLNPQYLSTAHTAFCECAGIETPCNASCGASVQKAYFAQITVTYALTGQYQYPNNPLYPAAISKTIVVRTP